MRPRILVLSLLVVVSLVATAETPVAPLVFGRAPGDQRQPRIAASDGTYFVAWRDERESVDGQAYGARLTADGTLLDPIGIRLDGVGTPGAVGCGGGRCVVVDSLLNFAMIDRDGKVVEGGKVADSGSGNTDVIFNGRDFLVFADGNGVRGWTLSVNGQVRGEPVTVVPVRAASPQRFHAAAFNGSRFVVLYSEDNLLKAAVTSSTGAPLTTDVILAPAPAGIAAIAASENEFAAIWKEHDELRALRFGVDGAWIGDPVTVRSAAGFSFDIARERDGYVVYGAEPWPDARLTATSLSRSLAVGETRVVLAPQPFAVGQVAAAVGAGKSVAVVDVSHPNQTSRGSEIYAVGTATAPVMVSRAASAQRNPKIAIGAETMLVVSEEDRGGGPDQAETLIQATFTNRRTGLSSTFTVAPSDDVQTLPEIAGAGDTYLVTWIEQEALRGRIIHDGGGGVVLDIAPQTFRSASVSSDGRDFFVAWFEFARSAVGIAKISTSGELLARETPISLAAPFGVPSIAIACRGDECLLAWRNVTLTGPCSHFICPYEESLLAARMSTSFVMRDATPIVLVKNQVGIGEITAAAADNGTYAVAWDVAGTVRAREIDALGIAGPVIERQGDRSTIARQDDAWLLLRDTSTNADSRIVATRCQGSNTVDFPITPVDAQTRRHASAANDGERVVVAYERTTRGEAAGGPPRAYLETIDAPPPKARAVRR